MGSKLTIHNRTSVIMNIALKQVGNLYWKNQLMPDEEWTVEVGKLDEFEIKLCNNIASGKVWFTIEVKLWKSDGSNDYTMAGAIVPVLTTSATVVGLTAGIAIPVAGAAGFTAARVTMDAIRPIGAAAFHFVPSGVNFVFNLLNKIKSEPPWLTSHGEYMSGDKRYEIVGGPHASEVTIKYSDRDSYVVVDQSIRTDSGNLGKIYLKNTQK